MYGMGTIFKSDRFGFATAGLTVLMIFQYVLECAAPEFVKTSFGLGIGVMLLGSLIIYAVPKEK